MIGGLDEKMNEVQFKDKPVKLTEMIRQELFEQEGKEVGMGAFQVRYLLVGKEANASGRMVPVYGPALFHQDSVMKKKFWNTFDWGRLDDRVCGTGQGKGVNHRDKLRLLTQEDFMARREAVKTLQDDMASKTMMMFAHMPHMNMTQVREFLTGTLAGLNEGS